MNKEVVNKYFNDDVSTKMLSRSKYGEKYIERIIEASIPEHIKEVMIKNRDKKNVKREELNLSRNIGINKNIVDGIVDSLFYIEKYDSLVDVEFNSSNSFMNINKNDTYVDLLSLYDVVNSKKYNEKYKVTQVNFDAFDRFHDNEGVYIILENEYHTKKIYENTNIKIYINLAYFYSRIYNEIREEKYNQLLYLVRVFILKKKKELKRFYNKDKEVIEMLEGMDRFLEEFGDLFKYDKVEYARMEGEELGYDRGVQFGLEQGISQGISQGVSQGIKQNRMEMINKMIEKGYDIDEILELTDATKDELKTINKSKNNKRPKIRTKLKKFIFSFFS